MVRILLADDQQLVRAGFGMLLDSAADIEGAGEAADGEKACRLARATRADAVLMDIRMPRLDGAAATRRIAADEDPAGGRGLGLTPDEADDFVDGARRAGASGFLVRDTQPKALLQALTSSPA